MNVDQLPVNPSTVFLLLIFSWGFWILFGKPIDVANRDKGKITLFMYAAGIGFVLRFVFSLHIGTENIQTMLGALFTIDVFVLLILALLEIGGSLLFPRAKKDPPTDGETKSLEP